MSDTGNDMDGAVFWRWTLLLLVILVPWCMGDIVEAYGLRSTLLGFFATATIAVAVMVLTFRVLRAIRARCAGAVNRSEKPTQSSTSRYADGAKGIKLAIGCMYVLALIVLLPGFGALQAYERDILAGIVYAIYIVTTAVVWFLVDTQTIERRLVDRHWRFRAPRKKSLLPAPSVDGGSSEEDDDDDEDDDDKDEDEDDDDDDDDDDDEDEDDDDDDDEEVDDRPEGAAK